MRVVLRCCPCVFCKNAEKPVAVIIRAEGAGRDILLSVGRQIAESSSMVFYENSVFRFQQSLKFFKRCGTFCNVRNSVADFFFARFKSGVHGSDALDHKLHVGNVQILLTALFGVILLRRNSVRGRGEQIDLMQSLPSANIHQGFLQVLQIVFGKVVFVSASAIRFRKNC